MTMRPLIALALGVMLAGPDVVSASSRGPVLAVRGVARLPSGEPVVKTRVTALLHGHGRFTATSDDSGRFALDLPLPDRAALSRDSTQLQLWVTGRDLHFAAPDGQASLGLVLKLERAPDGGERVMALANDLRLATMAANAVASGTRVELNDVCFTGALGVATHDPYPPARTQTATVTIGGTGSRMVTAPASAADSFRITRSPEELAAAGGVASATSKSPSATQAPNKSTTKPGSTGATGANSAGSGGGAGSASAGSSPATGASKTGPPAASSASANAGKGASPATGASKTGAPAASSVSADTVVCACRIAGTVETTSGPLPAPLRLVVSVQGLAAPVDTVTLDMGSPRSFDLRGVPCGPHRLVVRPLTGKHRYDVLDPEHLSVSCEQGRRVQPQILLVPH
ncbi:MAG: hypothetical protein ACHQ52_05265 [Candidatus Eisenbacteria bacterium]